MIKRREQDSQTDKAKEAKAPTSPPHMHDGERVRALREWIVIVATGIGIVLLIMLVVLIGLIVWDYLSDLPRPKVQWWALGSIFLLPIAFGFGVFLGTRLADYRLRWFTSDMDRLFGTLAAALWKAGTEASDVRIYGAERMLTGWEQRGSQEIDLGDKVHGMPRFHSATDSQEPPTQA